MGNKGNDRGLNFVLENKHYQNMDLILYLICVLLVIIVFLITHLFIENYIIRTCIVALFSLYIGISLVYNRNLYRKKLSDLTSNQKRVRIRSGDKEGLKITLRRITPKSNNLKLKIREKISLGEKLAKLKYKFTKNRRKNSKKYIEIKD